MSGILRRCRVCGKLFTEEDLKTKDGKLRCPNCGSGLFNVVRNPSNPKEEVKPARQEDAVMKLLEDMMIEFPISKKRRAYEL